jgi:hypothetical protein
VLQRPVSFNCCCSLCLPRYHLHPICFCIGALCACIYDLSTFGFQEDADKAVNRFKDKKGLQVRTELCVQSRTSRCLIVLPYIIRRKNKRRLLSVLVHVKPGVACCYCHCYLTYLLCVDFEGRRTKGQNQQKRHPTRANFNPSVVDIGTFGCSS